MRAHRRWCGPLFLLAFLLSPVHMIALGLTHPQCGSLEIPFRVRQKYQVTPVQLVIFNAVPQQSKVRDLSIVNGVDTDFTIDSVESEKGFVKVTSGEKMVNGHRLKLKIPPIGQAEQPIYQGVLHMRMEGRDMAVPVHGMYVASRPQAKGGADNEMAACGQNG